MILPFTIFALGLIFLVWSADKFVDGASSAARYLGMSPFLIGMIIVGFGTSTPEMLVSALAASQGNASIALGNVFGSNIVNIGIILGVGALISPIIVHSKVLQREFPVLVGTSILVALLSLDGSLSRIDAGVMLVCFAMLMALSVRNDMKASEDTLVAESNKAYKTPRLSKVKACFFLFAGLAGLLVSSKMLVWGAVEVAKAFGVSDLVIGLTIVALGTSLPELAASVGAALKKEYDIALGNVIGSNLFNILAVLGIAGYIQPMEVAREVLVRDMSAMMGMTLVLWFFCCSWRGGPGRINRFEAAFLISAYVAYATYLVFAPQ
jgi:cation:H+ antiporter